MSCLRLTVLLAWCSLVATGSAAAERSGVPDGTGDDKPVDLPEFVVTDTRLLPPPEPWWYGRLDGMEILANASEGRLADVLRQFGRFRLALSMVWPVAPPAEIERTIVVLCESPRSFEAFLPAEQRTVDRRVLSLVFRRAETSAIVVDFGSRSLLPTTAPVSLAPALDGLEDTMPSLEGMLDVDPYRLLFREYLRLQFMRAEPRAPAWFEEGLAQLLVATRITEQSITVGHLEDPNEAGAARRDGDFSAALADVRLMPFLEMLAVPHASDAVRQGAGNLWAKQCYAFVHWGAYGDFGRNRKAFHTFLLRASREEVTPSLVRECLGHTAEEMAAVLRSYTEMTRFNVAGVRAAKGERLPDVAPVEVRRATDAEAGLLVGEALLLAGRTQEAREALIAPYLRGERTARLLGQLGLLEAERGAVDRARRLLEAGAKAGMVSPRAYLALARLRRAAFDPGSRLDAGATASVLAPLYVAARQAPALPEVFRMIADVWQASIVSPGRDRLEVLERAEALFAMDDAFLETHARLCLRAGDVGRARQLVERALGVTADEGRRDRLEALKAALPAARP